MMDERAAIERAIERFQPESGIVDRVYDRRRRKQRIRRIGTAGLALILTAALIAGVVTVSTIAQRPGRSPASDLPADAPVEQRGDRRIRHYNGWSACAGSRWPRGLRREVQRLLHLDTFSQLVARR